jgi:hypothetical protein
VDGASLASYAQARPLRLRDPTGLSAGIGVRCIACGVGFSPPMRTIWPFPGDPMEVPDWERTPPRPEPAPPPSSIPISPEQPLPGGPIDRPGSAGGCERLQALVVLLEAQHNWYLAIAIRECGFGVPPGLTNACRAATEAAWEVEAKLNKARQDLAECLNGNPGGPGGPSGPPGPGSLPRPAQPSPTACNWIGRIEVSVPPDCNCDEQWRRNLEVCNSCPLQVDWQRCSDTINRQRADCRTQCGGGDVVQQ